MYKKNITLMFEGYIQAFVAQLGKRCFCWCPSATLVPIQVGNRNASQCKFL